MNFFKEFFKKFKVEKIFLIIGVMGYLAIALIKDKNLSGSLAFIVWGSIHVLCSNWLSRQYNKNTFPLAPKTSPNGLKILGVMIILFGIWIYQ